MIQAALGSVAMMFRRCILILPVCRIRWCAPEEDLLLNFSLPYSSVLNFPSTQGYSGPEIVVTISPEVREAVRGLLKVREHQFLYPIIEPQHSQWVYLDLRPLLSRCRMKENCVGVHSLGRGSGFGSSAIIPAPLAGSSPGSTVSPPSPCPCHQ